MKVYRMAIVLLLVFGAYSLASAAKEPSNRWDNILDVAYKFSWYPPKDLKDLHQEYCRNDVNFSSDPNGLTI